jgi:SAM-dependent methyltransferase
MDTLISAKPSRRASAPSAPGAFGTRVRAVAMRATMTALFAAAFTVSGAAREVSQSGASATAFPKPDRPVADIVSPIWHDEKQRDDAGESGQLVRLLGIKAGMTVADIGAGSGYYVVRLSPVVGPKGRIIAEDVMPEYLQGLRKRVRDLGLHNVTVTLGQPHDPTLPTGSVDIAILVHMYHEVTQPYGLLYNLVPALKRGARVGIVDAFAPTSEHGTPPGLLRCELAAVGYREISFDRLKGSDTYLALFAPPSVATRTRPEAIVACKAP